MEEKEIAVIVSFRDHSELFRRVIEWHIINVGLTKQLIIVQQDRTTIFVGQQFVGARQME